MKTIYLSLALALGLNLSAQDSLSSEENYPIPAWQVGVVVSDLVVPAFSIEGSMAYSNQAHLGIRLISPNYLSYFGSDLYQGTNWGLKTHLFQKFFLPMDEIHALSFKHGPRFGIVDNYYEVETWVERQEFGNTVLAYEEVQGSDLNISLGYEVQFGFQTRSTFYYEIYIGLLYEQIVNQSNMSVLEYRDPEAASLEYFGPGYEYEGFIRPTIGLILGLGRD